jgi:lysozyme family protein
LAPGLAYSQDQRMTSTAQKAKKQKNKKQMLCKYSRQKKPSQTTQLLWVARFFLTQCTKTKEKYQITTALPNGHTINQMTVKYFKLP